MVVAYLADSGWIPTTSREGRYHHNRSGVVEVALGGFQWLPRASSCSWCGRVKPGWPVTLPAGRRDFSAVGGLPARLHPGYPPIPSAPGMQSLSRFDLLSLHIINQMCLLLAAPWPAQPPQSAITAVRPLLSSDSQAP